MVDAAPKNKKKEEPVVHLTDEQIYEELKKLALVFEVARDNFVEEADEKKMLEAAMNGMLGALDPHSSYLSADDFKEFNDKSQGEFGGLGIQITSDRGAVRVISPIDDTPADKAGIKAGDYITHIDGEQVFDLTLNQAVKKMKGRPGTKVKLTIISDGEEKTLTLKRAIIKVESVKHDVKTMADADPWLIRTTTGFPLAKSPGVAKLRSISVLVFPRVETISPLSKKASDTSIAAVK